MKIHRTVQTNSQQRITEIAEIISELRDPMKAEEEEKMDDVKQEESEEEAEAEEMSKAEKDRMLSKENSKRVDIGKLVVKLDELKDDLEKAIRAKEFLKAQDLQLEIDETEDKISSLQEELALLIVPRSIERKVKTKKKTALEEEPKEASQTQKEDPQIIHKCLVMLFQLMQSPDITSLNATLQTFLDEFVMTSLSSVNHDIKMAALKALGTFSLRSLDMAKRHILLFSQIALVDVVTIRVTALEVIFDLLMLFGMPAFIDQEDTIFESQNSSMLNTSIGTCNNPVVARLSELLDDRDLEVRTKVTEGLCKLLLSKVITSSKLFTRLILMWYNPVTDANGKLRHILGAFLPLYASLSKENQDSIAEAFMPTLKTLGSAPVTSPLNEVDMDDVGMFFISLTQREFLQSQEADLDNLHDGLAYSICNQIIAEPLSFHVKLYSKFLASLIISSDDSSKLRDKLALKNLEKFEKRVTLFWEQNPDPQPPSNVQDQNEPANTLNNTTKLLKKRQLFSQTCNTLLEDSNEVDTDDNVFATPKTKVTKITGEMEITRVEESPVLDKDSEEDNEEIVSGNIANARKVIDLSDGDEEFPVTTSTQLQSTQIEQPSSSKRSARRLNSSTEASSVSESSEDDKMPQKRSAKGKLKKPVEPSKPQRKSRRLDSSTGTESDNSPAAKPQRKSKRLDISVATTESDNSPASKPQRKSKRLDSSTATESDNSSVSSAATRGNTKKRSTRKPRRLED